jgi:hypothetical protein
MSWNFALLVGEVVSTQFMKCDHGITGGEYTSQGQAHNSTTPDCICSDDKNHVLNGRGTSVVKKRSVDPGTKIMHLFRKKGNNVPQPQGETHGKQCLKHRPIFDIILRFMKLASFAVGVLMMAMTRLAT